MLRWRGHVRWMRVAFSGSSRVSRVWRPTTFPQRSFCHSSNDLPSQDHLYKAEEEQTLHALEQKANENDARSALQLGVMLCESASRLYDLEIQKYSQNIIVDRKSGDQ